MSDKVYKIINAAVKTDLAGKEFDHAAWEASGLPTAAIDSYVWPDEGYRPEAYAGVYRTESGFQVLMCAKEKTIAAEERKFGGEVYKDSCLEFFLQPCPEIDERYINFEVNAIGTMHIGIGKGRAGRYVFDQVPDGIKAEHSEHHGAWWAVSYSIPFEFLTGIFGHLPEREMRGNFYCCDESIHPHFGTWNRVIADQPDFHRPECFGRIVWEK